MSIARALAMLAGGVNGYAAGKEEQRQQDRQKAEDAWKDEQRQRTRTEWARADEDYEKRKKEDEDVKAAAAPVSSTQEELQGPVTDDMAPMPTVHKVGGQAFGSRAEADAAASAMNTPGARMRRAAGVMRDPVKAAQTEAAAGQADLVAQQQAAARWEQDVGQAMRGGWKGLTDLLTASHADQNGGKDRFMHTVSPDGKTVTVAQIDDKGQPVPGESITVPNSQEGLATLAFTLKSRTKPEAMLAHYRQVAQDQLNREDKEADNKRADEAERRRGVHEDRMYQVALRQLTAAQGRAGGAGAGAGAGPVWDDKADQFLRDRYTVKDPVSGATEVDGSGMQFGKVVALASAQGNGGDTTRALGFAFEKDQQLRAAATDPKGVYDPAKHKQLRMQYVQSIMNPQAPAAAPAAPTSETGKAVAAAPAGSVVLKDGKYVTPEAAPASRMGAAAAAPAGDGMTFEQRREKVIQRQRAMSSDPDIIALQEKAKQAVKAGKRVEANDYLRQANELRVQRYGN